MLFLNLSKLQSEELLKTFMNHKTQRKGTVFGIMVSDIMSADCTMPERSPVMLKTATVPQQIPSGSSARAAYAT